MGKGREIGKDGEGIAGIGDGGKWDAGRGDEGRGTGQTEQDMKRAMQERLMVGDGGRGKGTGREEGFSEE